VTRSLLFFGSALLAAASLGGCGGGGTTPTDRRVLVVACDGTGPAEVGCTTAFLQGLFADWFPEAMGFPGSEFVVVTSGGTYGDTTVHAPLVVRAVWPGNARAAQEDWKVDGLQALGAIDIPVDDPAIPQNRSDLLSLVSLAAQVGTERAQAGFDLVVASDGVALSYGLNFSRSVPTAASTLAHLDRLEVTWDFEAARSVLWCGMTNAGSAPDQHGRRKALWGELVTAGGGPPFLAHANCQGLYPPPPVELLDRAASGERLQAMAL